MKTCVLTAGSLGSAIGGTLALAGNEVHLVARPKTVAAMNEHGLTLVSPDGTERVKRLFLSFCLQATNYEPGWCG